MPHAEESKPALNGEVPQSQFLSHLNSHPVVSDSVSAFKSNKYGSLTLTYADKSYAIFVSPLVPYARAPYSYISPYVSRADTLAAQGLDRVDATFPIITQDTNTIVDTAYGMILLPLKKAEETKSYVLSTWGQEYKANGGNGVVAGTKAVVTASLSITSDSLAWLSKFLSQAKQRGEVTVKELREKVSS